MQTLYSCCTCIIFSFLSCFGPKGCLDVEWQRKEPNLRIILNVCFDAIKIG